MRDCPRRRQHRSCDQCRAGGHRCDVNLNPQHGPGQDLDDSTAPATHSSCSNRVKWRKECTTDKIKSHKELRAQAHTVSLTGRQQEALPHKRSLSSNPARDNRPTGPTSLLSSHFLGEEQHRIDIRDRLLTICYDFLESSMVCWLMEKNCPFASHPVLDGRDEWRSNWSNKL